MRRIRLLEQGYPERPGFDTALSRALLTQVVEGSAPETLRIYRPADVLAFSIRDRTRPGFGRAVEAAREAGFQPVIRLAGGRAALFHTRSLAFAWSRPLEDFRKGLEQRFDEVAELARDALRALGVDARVGEIPGEYCPGAHSVNARGAVKIAGFGQRIVRGAAHVGGVVVVGESARLREVLVPVYRALEFPFAPETAGCVEDEVGPTGTEAVAEAFRAALARRHALEPGAFGADTLERAERLYAERPLADAGGPGLRAERVGAANAKA